MSILRILHLVAVEKALQTDLSQINIPVTRFWGNALYHQEDLPFEIKNIGCDAFLIIFNFSILYE